MRQKSEFTVRTDPSQFSQGGAGGGGGGPSRPKNRLSRISVLVEKRELLLSIAR